MIQLTYTKINNYNTVKPPNTCPPNTVPPFFQCTGKKTISAPKYRAPSIPCPFAFPQEARYWGVLLYYYF